jgi:hypothetical protein
MGMFKDIKKLSDQGKEIGKKSGRPTSMVGMMKNMPNDIANATAAVDDAMALQEDMQKQQQLLTSGTPGKATIKGFTDTGTLVNFNPQVVLDLEVAIEGKDAYGAQLNTSVPQIYLSQLQQGATIGVRVDPSDPSSIAIDWASAGQG